MAEACTPGSGDEDRSRDRPDPSSSARCSDVHPGPTHRRSRACPRRRRTTSRRPPRPRPASRAGRPGAPRTPRSGVTRSPRPSITPAGPRAPKKRDGPSRVGPPRVARASAVHLGAPTPPGRREHRSSPRHPMTPPPSPAAIGIRLSRRAASAGAGPGRSTPAASPPPRGGRHRAQHDVVRGPAGSQARRRGGCPAWPPIGARLSRSASGEGHEHRDAGRGNRRAPPDHGQGEVQLGRGEPDDGRETPERVRGGHHERNASRG